MVRVHGFVARSAALAALGILGGCGILLGLDDFTDAGAGGGAPSSSSATGTGGTTSCSPGAEEPCYSGTSATRGVGACKDGSRVCEDGDFGECLGETLPATEEDCSNDLDDDCNGQVNDGCPCQSGEVESCYDGPGGTAGKGFCKAGQHTCRNDGSGFDACEGQVLPEKEDCAKAGDEDCDGIPCSELAWVKQYGDTGDSMTMGIGVDPTSGDVYIGGHYSGAIDLGCGSLAAAGPKDAFLAKLNPDGTCSWSKHFGAAGAAVQLGALAVDGSGNVAVGGTVVGGTVSLGGADFAGPFVGTFDASGQHRWSRAADVPFVSLTLASTGDVVGFGNDVATNSVVLCKYSAADGSTAFVKDFNTANAASAGGVEVDANDNIFIAGNGTSSLTFGGPYVGASGQVFMFLAKLSSTGAHVWTRGYADPGSSARFTGLARDGATGMLVAGTFAGTVTASGFSLTSSGPTDSDVLLMNIGANGAAVFARSYGDPEVQALDAVVSDGMGSAYLIGQFLGSIDFGGTKLVSNGTGVAMDRFAAKVPLSDKDAVWVKQMPYPGGAPPLGGAYRWFGARAGDRGLYLGGSFSGTLDVTSGMGAVLTSKGAGDSFLARFFP